MSDCSFCKILNVETGEEKSKEDKILYEDDLIAIIPAKGAPVPGWILLIIKKHINGFAELTSDELLHVTKIIDKIKKVYKKHFDINSILLEHGSTSKGRHPQSIVHAHLHLIPFNFNASIESELLSELQLTSINSLQSIRVNKKMDYWLYCDPDGNFYTSCEILAVPRSIFMNLVARQKSLVFPYEWRKVETNENFLDEIIAIFRDNINGFMDEDCN